MDRRKDNQNIHYSRETPWIIRKDALHQQKHGGKPTTVFNINIFNSRAKKIWFGDIEIERDKQALLAISRRLGVIYIIYEMDGRFLKTIPTIDYIKEKALVIIEKGSISYNYDFAKGVEILKKKVNKKYQK